ncbi:MAG: transketolase [Calditrichaeota bacterium]|nr:transketolase [Calditrichota bacterium]
MIDLNEKAVRLKTINLSAAEIIADYKLAYQSRQASLIGRREVMGGKAKFGIFGDGKEIPQLALAKAFRKGDFRSGYYRDQTLLMALGVHSIAEFFAQLYAHADVEAEPASAGRSMNCHLGTRFLDGQGEFMELTSMYNSASDISPTGSQMPRLVGLAYASRLYRELPELQQFTQYSRQGNEIAFGTIGNASCAEGMFWEAVNAVGVLKCPMVLSIWDDGYGISVDNEHQILKEDISDLLKGFQRKRGAREGFDLYTVKGWDYPALIDIYQKAADTARKEHVPAIVHVVEVTQPQGHSTSGSHERYKSKERLQWEQDFDGLKKMREWMIEQELAGAAELDQLEMESRQEVEEIRDRAWEAFEGPIRADVHTVGGIIEELAGQSAEGDTLRGICQRLYHLQHPERRDVMVALRNALIATRREALPGREALLRWKEEETARNRDRYASHLYSESAQSALRVPEVKPVYSENSPSKTGFEVLNACFDAALEREPRLIAFGEDVGKIGDVNQGFRGLQDKYGPLRVSDTGIRECTIMGQAIGMAMRGLRPIAEIQYLDYVLYALQILSDDLATLQWRTKGGQKAPVIIRTRGHRLEGIWHSGSPMAGIIHLLRGIYVLVPRDMTRAAGFYNTLLQSDEPGLVVEVLNGYRLRETLPDNIAELTLPLGVPEILRPGSDVTVVTYGATCRIVMEAAELLAGLGVDVEVIDVQSLLPFDRPGMIVASLKKTSRVVFVDEDVPGGTTAYMMQEVLEKQGGYRWLDSEPRTLSAAPHRPAYGSDGDYSSKPNTESVLEIVYDLMHEANPAKYPLFFR